MNWTIHHKPETASTNLDARAGTHGDVFTADFQSAGRGRLDHTWHSAPGENLMMSAVLDVGDCPPERVATLPLVTGLAVIEGLSPFLTRGLSPWTRRGRRVSKEEAAIIGDATPSSRCGGQAPFGDATPSSRCGGQTPFGDATPSSRCGGQTPFGDATPSSRCGEGLSLKWPNDILVAGRKLAGILCERHGDRVIVGLGVNVAQDRFPSEVEGKATSLKVLLGPVPADATRASRLQMGPVPVDATRASRLQMGPVPVDATRASRLQMGTVPTVAEVRDAVLAALGRMYETWREGGLSPFLARLRAVDCLAGRVVSVRQTDDDREPLTGICEGIASDGSLLVAGRSVYAGEAHVCAM